MKLIATAGQKGGIGKSTLAVQLAGALALKGETVLSDEDEAVETATTWLKPALTPVRLLGPTERPPKSAAYYVLDIEARPDMPTLAALSKRALVLLPTGANGQEVEPMHRTWHRLKAAGAVMERVRVVVTKAPPTGRIGQDVRDDLRERGLTVCETVVRAYKAYERAFEQRVLVRDVPESDRAWADILSLALEVC